jgi:hypothetical protein
LFGTCSGALRKLFGLYKVIPEQLANKGRRKGDGKAKESTGNSFGLFAVKRNYNFFLQLIT